MAPCQQLSDDLIEGLGVAQQTKSGAVHACLPGRQHLTGRLQHLSHQGSGPQSPGPNIEQRLKVLRQEACFLPLGARPARFCGAAGGSVCLVGHEELADLTLPGHLKAGLHSGCVALVL